MLASDVTTSVFNSGASINILTIRLVEYLSWERVLRVISDVIINHENYIFLGDSVILNDMISVMSIGLMAIIVVLVRASNNDSPVG